MKKQLSTLTLALALLASVTASAQNDRKIIPCYTEEATQAAIQNNPEAIRRLKAAQAEMRQGLAQRGNAQGKTGAAPVYTIPVVFHVMHQGGPENLPDQTLINALDFVNKDLAKAHNDASLVAAPYSSIHINSDIRLMLAKKDPNGNCINGIVRHFDAKAKWSQSQAFSASYWSYTWDPTKYLNIYIVAEIVPQNTVVGGGIIVGYTYKPGTWGTGDPHDAIVYRYDFLGTNSPYGQARSLTHELGHWLSLPHTWGNTNNPGVQCGDDGIADTPPTRGNFGGCPSSLSGNPCAGSGGFDNIQNIMNYSDCPLNFTTDQTTAMRNALASPTSGRNNLSSAGNLTFTDVDGSGLCAPVAELMSTTNNYTVCKGASLNFKSISYNGAITSYSWMATNNASVSSPGASLTLISFPTAGSCVITLSVSNNIGGSSASRTVTVLDLGAPIADTLYTESFEAQGVPNNWQVINAGGLTWQQNQLAAHDGSGSMYIEGFNTPNAVEYLQMPLMDMFGKDTMRLTFRYAYARNSASSADAFEVQGSTDCGGTWKTIMALSSTQMASGSGGIVPSTTSLYIPTSNQWKFVNLNSNDWGEWYNLTGYNRVLVRFMFKNDNSGFSNRFFLDHVNLIDPYHVPVGFKELVREIGFRMFPNPTNGQTHLKFTLSDASEVNVQVLDITGRTVLPAQHYKLGAGEHELKINEGNALSKGVYFVNMSYNGSKLTQKLIIH